MQSKTTAIPAQLNGGIRRASKVVTERYESLWRPKADHFLDWLDGVGDRLFWLLATAEAAHLPPLQVSNKSRDGGTLLRQWKGENEGISFGGAGPMNAAATLPANSPMAVSHDRAGQARPPITHSAQPPSSKSTRNSGWLARISHTAWCVGAANQRKLLCSNDLSPTRRAPRCRQSVARICLDSQLLKDAK